MASKYFTMPSFAKAQRNKEQLEKTNPQNPVLKDEDEKFLEKHISQDQPSGISQDTPPSKIDDQGVETVASAEDVRNVVDSKDQIAIPATSAEVASPQTPSKKKNKVAELPSQEEAEAATRVFNFNPSSASGDKAEDKSRTWASYLPSIPSISPVKKDSDTSEVTEETKDQRTWAEYASSYIPNSLKPKDKDSQPEPVYNDDGTINEAETARLQEREVSVLLDNLNMSSINNRVFALSGETQKIYERFAQCLKDTMNGVPTAYDDMEKLMKEAGPQLEKQFKAMPPFVQTLVKSLPAKLSAGLAPEILAAAASEKPGEDLKKRMEKEGKSATGGSTQKKKRKIPNLKKLVSQEGAVASILKNVVNFIKVRFPLLASGTNVIMTLAVFILMFVFWYCHKRGKETRLAQEAETDKVDGADYDSVTAEASSEDEDETDADNDKSEILNQPHPSQIPLPAEKETEEKTL